MSGDEFSNQGGKAFQNVALGVAGLAGGPASVAITAGVGAFFNIFDAVATANTQAFQEARIAALEDDLIRVRDEVRTLQAARVAEGKPIGAPDAPTQTQIFSDFVEAVSSAPTSEKRTALVHAAARQFDPDLGSVAVRKHWFDEVRRLSDMEIFAIRMLAREGILTFTSQHKANSARNPTRTFLVLQLSDDEHVALRATVLRLDEGPYVSSPVVTQRRGSQYKLSVAGSILARYIDEAPQSADTGDDHDDD